MKHPWMEQFELAVRAHWWRGVIALLGIVLALQLYSWASTLLDFNRINHLISQAEDLSAKPESGNQPPDGQPKPPKEPAKNIFKKEDVQYQLTAILMDYAVINGQNVKVGEKAGKAEVKEIGNDFVVIQEEGKEQTTTLSLFQGGNSSGGGENMMMMSAPPMPNLGGPQSPNGNPSNRISASPKNDPANGTTPMEAMKMVETMGMGGVGMGMRIESVNISPEQMQAMQFGGTVMIESR